jgi:hypothetical protein
MFTENDVTFLSALYFVGKSVDIFVACDDWWCTFDANGFLYVLLYASMTRQRFYVSKEAHQTLGALFHCLFAQLHSNTLRCENRLQQYLLVITEVLLQRLMIIQVLNVQAYALRYRRILQFKHTISLR